MDEQQEQTVARGLREGRAEAWHALYEAYAQPVWQYVARRMGSDSTDVADVVQGTFLAAARSAGGYDPGRGSLWFWLVGITRNQLALFYRKRQQHDPIARGEEHAIAQINRWLNGDRPDPADAMARAEMAGLIQSVLARLSPDYEYLLSAKYCNGDSVEQIAARQNRSTTAVRSKLARARKAFRRSLMKTAPDLVDTSISETKPDRPSDGGTP
ncbi:MAG: sigma-70 family RNA polymerase sigma factor [Pirellulales bacterium]|nr:sigma-70 family RNA polymerase sigma factor [Pirellulales bacterium]